MGISVAAALLLRGHRVLWCGKDRSSATRLRADSFNLVEMFSLEQLVSAADVVISLCPPAEALDVATQVAKAWVSVVRQADESHAAAGDDMIPPVYVDANGLSPRSVENMRAMLAENGLEAFVDACIIGPPGWDMGTTR